MPGLEKLGMGGFNVKLIKLHGSLNWLQCPRCLRVYVDLDNKIAIDQYLHPVKCRHCNKNFGENVSHVLVSNAIMPTFLKNFSNPQYKLIWQNAGVELAEASKIVFIGYSLPAADFEMRQLLSRMVRDSAEIHVVDWGDEDSERCQATRTRYRTFFGNRTIGFDWKGAKAYVSTNFK
jgi:NAD-dependent SIR2 family protein deacetylase